MEHAHRDFVAASRCPAAAAAAAATAALGREGNERRDGSVEPPPLAFEEFMEGLSEDFPPLSRDVLEACEGLEYFGASFFVFPPFQVF